jgi:multiple sugar transport system ATP-binding protein
VSLIRLQNISRRYQMGAETIHALRDVSLEIQRGEYVAIMGPSGSGKSTLMNVIGCLDTPTAGRYDLNGVDVSQMDDNQLAEVRNREIGFIFQTFNLLPRSNALHNVELPLIYAGLPTEGRRQTALEALAHVGLADRVYHKPNELSGGQRQRVAMGRALVRDPQIFLFDEPLSNLDAKLRVEMRTEIKRLHHRLGTTIVYVTHDQIEAMTLATRIAVMRDGEVQQYADPQTVYEQPANMFVAGFMGSPPMNFLPGVLVRDGAGFGTRLGTGAGESHTFPIDGDYAEWLDREIVLGLRPEAIAGYTTHEAGAGAGQHEFSCIVDVIEPTGADTMVFMTLCGTEAIARVRPQDAAKPGATMRFYADMAKACLFDPATGRRIAAGA